MDTTEDTLVGAGAGTAPGPVPVPVPEPSLWTVTVPVSALRPSHPLKPTAFHVASGSGAPDTPVDPERISDLIRRGKAVSEETLGPATGNEVHIEEQVDDLVEGLAAMFSGGGVKEDEKEDLMKLGHLGARKADDDARLAKEAGAGAGAGTNAGTPLRHIAEERRSGVISVEDLVILPPAGLGAYGVGRSLDDVIAERKKETGGVLASPSSDDPTCMYPYRIDSGIRPDMSIHDQRLAIEAWMAESSRTRLWSVVGVTRGGLLVMTNGMWFRAAPVSAVKHAVKETQATDPVGAGGQMFAAVNSLWKLLNFVVPLTHNVHGLSSRILDDVLVVSAAEGSVYFVNVEAAVTTSDPKPLTAPNDAGVIMVLHVVPLPHGSPPKKPIWVEVGAVPVLWFWSPTAAARAVEEITTRLYTGGHRTLEEARRSGKTMHMADASAMIRKRAEIEAQQKKMRTAFHTEPGSGAPQPPTPEDFAPAWARGGRYCELWRQIHAVGMPKTGHDDDDADADADADIGNVFGLLGVTSPVDSVAVCARAAMQPGTHRPSVVLRAHEGMAAGTLAAPRIALAIQGGPPIVVFPASRHVVTLVMSAEYEAAVAARRQATTEKEVEEHDKWNMPVTGNDIDQFVCMANMSWAGSILLAQARDSAEWFSAVVTVSGVAERLPIVAQTGTSNRFLAVDSGTPPPVPGDLAGADDHVGLSIDDDDDDDDGDKMSTLVAPPTTGRRRERSRSIVDSDLAAAAMDGLSPGAGAGAGAASAVAGARRRLAGSETTAPVSGHGSMYSVQTTFGSPFNQLAPIRADKIMQSPDPRIASVFRGLGEARGIAGRLFGGPGGNTNFQVAALNGDTLSIYTCTPTGNSAVSNVIIPGADDIAFLEDPVTESNVLFVRLQQSNDVAVFSVAITDVGDDGRPVVDVFPDFVIPGGFRVSGRAFTYNSVVSTVDGGVVSFRRSASTVASFCARPAAVPVVTSSP